MSDHPTYDAALIGSGQAAPALAVALGARGQQVALIEGHLWGGSCVNVGCTPTKTLRKSARVAYMARRAAEFGVHVGEVRVDFAAAMQRVADYVANGRKGLEGWVGKSRGVTLLHGWARFTGREGELFAIEVDGAPIRARRVYLNTGTRPFIPPIPGLDPTRVLTNETVLDLRERPAHLIILGGSYIGLELGQIFRRLDCNVTILELAPAVASREDADVSARITQLLTDEGVRIHAGVGVEQARHHAEGITLTIRLAGADAPIEVTGSHLLVATGRLPNTERLNLEAIGLATERGFIPVNGHLETAVPGVWALGDVNRRGAFTHTSYQDHEIVVANLDGRPRTADGRLSTYAMFTDPPLGRVGMTETEARALQAEGRRFLLATHEMKFVSRAKEEGETVGVIKVLVDAATHRFVGATVFGIGGDEIIQVISAQMAADAPYQVLRDALPVHPTVTEFFPTILGKLKPLA